MKFENGQEVRYKGDKYHSFIYVGDYPKTKKHGVACSKGVHHSGLFVVRLDEIEAVDEDRNVK